MTTLAIADRVPSVLRSAKDGIGVTKAAEEMGVTRATILNWIKAGVLPSATQFGPPGKRGQWRIDPADLENMRRSA